MNTRKIKVIFDKVGNIQEMETNGNSFTCLQGGQLLCAEP